MRTTLTDLVVDCWHRRRWHAELLDGYAVASYSYAELQQLARVGINSTKDDPMLLVEAAAGSLRLFSQHVPELKTVKNWLRLDLQVDDLAA